MAADALSRVQRAELLILAISSVNSDILVLIKQSYLLVNKLQQVLEQLQHGKHVPNYSLQDGLLRKRGKLVTGPDEQLKLQILKWMHDSPTGGHSGRDATLKRVKGLFNWKGMIRSIQHFIR